MVVRRGAGKDTAIWLDGVPLCNPQRPLQVYPSSPRWSRPKALRACPLIWCTCSSVRASRAGQPANAPRPISCTDAGMRAVTRAVQPANASGPIVVRPSGRVIERRQRHFTNAWKPISCNDWIAGTPQARQHCGAGSTSAPQTTSHHQRQATYTLHTGWRAAALLKAACRRRGVRQQCERRHGTCGNAPGPRGTAGGSNTSGGAASTRPQARPSQDFKLKAAVVPSDRP